MLELPQAMVDAIVAHARRDHPDEACGIVAGPEGSDRPERLEPCRTELRKARSILRTDLVLAPDAADRWIRVLNDARLTIGTRLDISEDDDGHLDATDPNVRDRARYVWLTALQDLLVTSLMGAAGDDRSSP